MDLALLQENWLVAVGVGAGLLLLLIVLVALRPGAKAKGASPGTSQRSTTPQPAPKKAPAPVAERANDKEPAKKGERHQQSSASSSRQHVDIALDWKTSTPNDWRTIAGSPAADPSAPLEFSPTGLRIGPSFGVVSAVSRPAGAGDKFVCEFEARLATPPTNGKPVNFFVGPVTRDAAGNLVGYWIEQPAFAPGESTRKGAVEMTAPAASATVHVGIHGSWAAEGAGDGEVQFTRLQVRSV